MEKKVWHYLSNIRRAKKNINLTQNVMGVARAMLLSSTDLLFVSPPEVRLSVAILTFPMVVVQTAVFLSGRNINGQQMG